jgi:hypothetical protein
MCELLRFQTYLRRFANFVHASNDMYNTKFRNLLAHPTLAGRKGWKMAMNESFGLLRSINCEE